MAIRKPESRNRERTRQHAFRSELRDEPGLEQVPESAFMRIDKGIQAHSAPLGIAFLQDSKVPEPFCNGAALALTAPGTGAAKRGTK